MTSDHMADIRRVFGYLFQNDQFGTQQERQFESFGNWVVVLQSPDCRMRIFQDRGYISIAFGPVWSPPDWEAGPWFDLEVIFEYLSVKYTLTNEDVIRESGPVFLEHHANMLKPHLRSICDLFQAEAFPSHRAELERIADDLSDRYWGALMAPQRATKKRCSRTYNVWLVSVLGIVAVVLVTVIAKSFIVNNEATGLRIEKDTSYFSNFYVEGAKVYIECELTIRNSNSVDKSFQLDAILRDDVESGLLKSENLRGYNQELTNQNFIIGSNETKTFRVVFVGDFAGKNRKHDRNLPEIVITTVK